MQRTPTQLYEMKNMRNSIGYAVPGVWLERLIALEGYQRTACIGLLKVQNFRSPFRKSLRDQLETWLNGLNTYPKPFTWKQWKCLVKFRKREDYLD